LRQGDNLPNQYTLNCPLRSLSTGHFTTYFLAPYGENRRVGWAPTAAGFPLPPERKTPREEAATSCNQKFAVLSHFLSYVRVNRPESLYSAWASGWADNRKGRITLYMLWAN
jgi:hypothetical protein